MHVYTLVWLKSDRIGFFIVGLKHPDYSFDSRITPIFPQGCEPEVDGQRRRLSSEITVRKSAIVHLVCVIIMYTIYEMYKDVASPRSSYTIFLECRGSWWRNEVNRKWLCYH